ncbi:MAG: filamentous hemagglutinin N-terminal domain-containing protein [Phyllobacteriaceae bacterium]|nr:filamentous hemagglutinin N-terminal domain-containing protein [Phyllobacteriaceae bacterium]
MVASPQRYRLLASTALGLSLLVSSAAAQGPDGGRVVAGDASIARPDGQSTTINQFSQRAIVDWRQFHVGQDHTVTFAQPNTDAVILNRITGGAPSQIMGNITANGTVMLVNPDGILFGAHSNIDVGGLVASTADIANDDFMAGRYEFNQPGNPQASIVNEGRITVRDSGVAALVAPGVRNSGVISARLGQVALASANQFTLDLYGDNLIKLKIDDEIIDQVIDVATGQPMAALVDNQGMLSASGGQVALTAVTARRVVDHVINNDGIIEADTVGMANGKIILGAQTAATKTPQAPPQNVRVSGEIRARGVQSGQTGGNIHIVGEMIGLTRASINASGPAGGGLVLVGGDIQGGNASAATLARYGLSLQEQDIPTATNVTVDRASLIDASATENGDGGRIIAWADDTMDFQGTVAAKGGRLGGDGGFAEVSGWQRLMFDDIEVELTAPNGNAGTVLFDPDRLVINRRLASAIEDVLNSGTNTDVSAGHIHVVANILKTSGGNATLALFADDGIEIASGVTIGSSSGRLNLILDANADLLNDDGELITAARRAVANLRGEIQQAMFRYAFENPPSVTSESSVRAFANALLDIIRNSDLPADEILSLDELVALMTRRGDITDGELAEHNGSRVLNRGSLLLNGGTLTQIDNQGTARILGESVPAEATIISYRFETSPGVFETRYDFTFDPSDGVLDLANNVKFTPASKTSNIRSALPGAQVVDLRSANPATLGVAPSAYDFGALLSIGTQYGQDAHTIWALRSQTGYLALTNDGLKVLAKPVGATPVANDSDAMPFEFDEDITTFSISRSITGDFSLDFEQVGRQYCVSEICIQIGVVSLSASTDGSNFAASGDFLVGRLVFQGRSETVGRAFGYFGGSIGIGVSGHFDSSSKLPFRLLPVAVEADAGVRVE